jgi:hypothetical protein
MILSLLSLSVDMSFVDTVSGTETTVSTIEFAILSALSSLLEAMSSDKFAFFPITVSAANLPSHSLVASRALATFATGATAFCHTFEIVSVTLLTACLLDAHRLLNACAGLSTTSAAKAFAHSTAFPVSSATISAACFVASIADTADFFTALPRSSLRVVAIVCIGIIGYLQ